MATGPALILGDQVFPLNKVTNSIGRKDRITNMVPDVDLATIDQDRAVSRKHAEANYLDGQMMLRDIGSTNGTLVNDERLQLQVDRAMTDGDRISLGGFEMVFAAAAAWPEGVEAEWPSAEAAAQETAVLAPDETAMFRPEETAVIAPGDATGTATAEQPWSPEADVYTPEAPAEGAAPEGEAVEGAEAEGAVAEGVAADGSAAEAAGTAPAEEGALEPWTGAPAAETPAEVAPVVPDAPLPPAAEAPVSFAPCTNHPHLPAVGLCPGCLEAFCIDCLPERPGQPLACNRCAGIGIRLGVGAQEPAPVAAGGFPPPEGPPAYPPPEGAVPNYTPPPDAGPAEEQKKRWPF